MKKKNIVFSAVMALVLILLAVLLYAFTYFTIRNSFFNASVKNTVENMQVIRDLGIQKVDDKLLNLKEDLEQTASLYGGRLLDGTLGDRVAVLASIPLPKDGIDYWYCTPDGKAAGANGQLLEWEEVPGLSAVFSGGESVVIDPYFTADEEYLLPVATPLYRDGQAAAALVLRLDGYCLSRWIKNVRFDIGEGSCYIIAGDGRNIATARKKNYDWITGRYNAQTIESPDDEAKSVAELERQPLEGKTGWGTYQWEGSTSYMTYAPMEQTNWGFFVGCYGALLGDYTQEVASKSTVASQFFILPLFIFIALLAIYANYNLRKEKGYTRALLLQKQEIQKQAEDLSVSEERFRIALERTSNIIFEYNFQTGNIINFRTTKEVVHYETTGRELKDSLIVGGELDKNSLPELERSLNEIREGMPKSECIVKARLEDGTMAWYRVSITSVSGHEKQPTRVIGILEDITKEKMAELDPLTGIYNRKVVTEQIQERLKQINDRELCAFLMLDIDDFKTVNDTYGHPAGDRVIIGTADLIKTVFSRHALVGRLGGDEFCVFCYGDLTMDALKKSLEELRGRMETHFTEICGEAPVTFSCGAAFSSGQGKTFEMLYQEADDAMYEAKNGGKNRCVFNMKENKTS